jgi:putative endonuclease
LCSNGLRIVERNFRCKRGEIDLVMRDGATVVFIEVRFRRSTTYGTPIETVTRRKQQRIVHAAKYYLANNPVLGANPCRFDIVGISGQGKSTELNWIKNAFSA